MVVQVVGVVLLALGFGMLATWAGFSVGGLGLVVLGTAAELGRARVE